MADLRDELCVDGEESIALPMGPGAAPPDEAAADAARLEASSAAAAGDWSAALAAWSAAIVASAEPAPQMFARRAEALLHLKHPSAALEDANAALSANPDSARALKAKGLAHRYRGEWADAAKALGEAQAIDFDDSVVAVLKLCVDKAAILQKRRVIEQNTATAASRREAAAAEARARAPPPPPPPPSGGGVVRHVKTEEEYTALLGESRPVVMDWTAAWCGPCRTIAPLVEELAKKHSGVSFVKVDVDEAQFLAQKHGITSMPTFMRFSRRGVKVAEFKGADPAALRRMAEDAAKE